MLARAEKVVAIEVDAVLVHYLRHRFHDALDSGKLELIEGDILKADLASLAGPKAGLTTMTPRPAIAGNLPYYITSPILEKTFALAKDWVCAVFLVQAEVAERITAAPGKRDFGYLSVLVQTHSHAEMLFPVSRMAFHPPPKVDSAVVRLTPRDAATDLNVTDVPAFLRFAQTCFRHKRKTLRNNLGPVYGAGKIEGLAEARLRAEQLGVAELAALYRRICDA